MKKTDWYRTLGVATALVLGASTYLVWKPDEQTETAHAPIGEPSSLPPDRLSLQHPRNMPHRTPTQQSPLLWEVVDERTVDESPAYDDRWSESGRALVDVSAATAAAPTWREGDRMAIELPQLGERYESVIERIDEGLGHARSARGMATGSDGRQRRFVVTVGPGRIFAYIDTPEGPYELTGDNRLAWLLPTSSMMAWVDFSKPDYLLTERRTETPREP